MKDTFNFLNVFLFLSPFSGRIQISEDNFKFRCRLFAWRCIFEFTAKGLELRSNEICRRFDTSRTSKYFSHAQNQLNHHFPLIILDSHPGMSGALWVLGGVLLFTIIEKIFSSCASDDSSDERNSESTDSQQELVDGRRSAAPPIKIAGYLNLMANSIDNFTQGLAVAASFLVSFRQGLLGTIAILCELKQQMWPHSLCSRNGTIWFFLFFLTQCMEFRMRWAILPFYCDRASVVGMRPKHSCSHPAPV